LRADGEHGTSESQGAADVGHGRFRRDAKTHPAARVPADDESGHALGGADEDHRAVLSQERRAGPAVKPLLWMVKLFYLQLWYSLSDPQTEELMHDSHAVQEFLGLDLGKDAPPDETTILRFRHLIENTSWGRNCWKR